MRGVILNPLSIRRTTCGHGVLPAEYPPNAQDENGHPVYLCRACDMEIRGHFENKLMVARPIPDATLPLRRRTIRR